MKRLALAVLLVLPVQASAYDYDSRWIGQRIRESRVDDDDLPRRPVRRYRAPEPQREWREPEQHPSTQVHGIVTRAHQRIQRDVLSNVVCMPSIESLSVEANSEDGAWKDAQRNWENLVRWKYGERFMAISSASDVIKRCSRSSASKCSAR